MTVYEKVRVGFCDKDDNLNQKKFDIIDKYTDGRCSQIFQLIWDIREYTSKYFRVFEESTDKHLLLEYDTHNVAYYDDELGPEFTFLSHHHSCRPNSTYDFVLERMLDELREPFLKAYKELEVLGEDSFALKKFKEEYGDILSLRAWEVY